MSTALAESVANLNNDQTHLVFYAKDEAKESYSIKPHEENLQQTERYTLCDVLEGKDC